MSRLLRLCALLMLAACGLRVGTDPASGDSGDPLFPICVATWSRDSADTTWTLRTDTLALDSLRASVLPVAESTFLAVVVRGGSQGAWLAPGARALELREASSSRLRWRDSRRRPGLIFVLPGTGTEAPLASPGGWTEQTISVFADHWPARIVRFAEGRRLVWSIDSARLSDTLLLDLSALPDSSCPIQPGADPSIWECRPR